MPKAATRKAASTKEPGAVLDDAGFVGRAARTRAQLLAAARLLFVTRGYHATRPQDIAQHAGLGHGTFYVHFPDKLACFLAFTEESSAELGRAVHTTLDGVEGFEEMLVAALGAIHRYAKVNPNVISTILHDPRVLAAGRESVDLMADHWAEFWGGILAVGQATGEVRRDLDVGFAGSAIVGIIRQASDYGLRHGRADDELLRDMRDMILHAVGSRRFTLSVIIANNEEVAT
ncbi:TetR/AcrR family transcriptional regulator [Rhodopila sp.]|uniref:TetR/AcrR family transcriptional regulator n=1 Tax=Rhodopila sp. TaxID=2480087 RepID=UPI003D0DDAD9